MQRGGDGGAAEHKAQQAPVARAGPKERRASQCGQRGDEADPVAELTQEHRPGLAVAGVSSGIVVRAQVRRPIDEHRAQERKQREDAERERRNGVARAKARASPQRSRKDLERQHDDDSHAGERVPATEGEHRIERQRKRERDTAGHRLNACVVAWRQGDQASKPLGEPERAHHQHEAADIGHAARGDCECCRISDEHRRDAEAEDNGRLRVARQSRAPRAIAGQDRKREGGRRGVEGKQRECIDGARGRLSHRHEEARNKSRRPGIILRDRLHGGADEQRPVPRIRQSRDHHRDPAIGHEVGDHQIVRREHDIGPIGGEAREHDGEQRRQGSGKFEARSCAAGQPRGEAHAERSGSETHEPQPRLWLDERAENNQRHACRNGLGQPGQRPIVQCEGQRKRRKAGETGDPDCEDRRRPGRGCVREKACRSRERDPGAAAERPAVNLSQWRERSVVKCGHARDDSRRWLRLSGWRRRRCEAQSEAGRARARRPARDEPGHRQASGHGLCLFVRLGFAPSGFGSKVWT